MKRNWIKTIGHELRKDLKSKYTLGWIMLWCFLMGMCVGVGVVLALHDAPIIEVSKDCPNKEPMTGWNGEQYKYYYNTTIYMNYSGISESCPENTTKQEIPCDCAKYGCLVYCYKCVEKK